MLKNHSFVFMGCKHCGKSTHGKAFAEKLGYDFYDVDDIIQQSVGMSVRDFYKQKGAAIFMTTEEAACKAILKKCKEEGGARGVVISTGGGVCDNPPALEVLRECGKFVFLKLRISTSVKRITEKIEEVSPGVFINLPAYLLKNNGAAPSSMEEIVKLLTDRFSVRTECYNKIADIVVDIKNASIDDNFNTIFKALSD